MMIDRFTTLCATCGKLLGTVTDDGWFWHTGTPARLVNRRRLVCELAADDVENAPASAPDNFRQRAIEKSMMTRTEVPPDVPGDVVDVVFVGHRYSLFEYPFTCNDDACMEGLGPEWQPGSDAMKYQIMPAGRVLS